MGFPVKKTGLPPMMMQYVEYKEKYSDALLFFQVGDFYELFYDDAVTVARSLNLTLTSRDKNSPTPIPMCGVPLSVLDAYIDRLLPLGFSVAVVSQTGSGQGVSRELERFVTPGMRLFTDTTSVQSETIIVGVGLNADGTLASFAFTDPQTGAIGVREELDLTEAGREIGALSACELVMPQSIETVRLDGRSVIVRTLCATSKNIALRFRSESAMSVDGIDEALSGVRSEMQSLSASAKRAVRLLAGYVDEISIGNMIPISSIGMAQENDAVTIDASTRQNLELFVNSRDGTSNGSLFNCIDYTCTCGGRRLLRRWLAAPQRDLQVLHKRQEGVTALQEFYQDIGMWLTGMSDLDRIAARVQLGVASPKDLGALRDTLERSGNLRELLESCNESIIRKSVNELRVPEQLLKNLQEALVESPPHKISEGGIIRDGYSDELDRIMSIKNNAEAWRTSFELQERGASGIASLKIKSNGVLGYFIEIPKSQSSKAPEHYKRRQSTANTERFVVPQLQEFENEITTAIDKQTRLEMELFLRLRDLLKPFTSEIRRISNALSLLDVLCSLARVAADNNWVQPSLFEDRRLHISDGRHPVVEDLIGAAFIPNSIGFDVTKGHACCIVTGPNMGGKSTFLRQVAIITILAQIGSHVPARSAEIGCVDRIFARLGSADNLHEGESTFMVEMREAAYILKNATDCSLVLIDELGRGTATSDGQSLAQAILEELAGTIDCRTLFATHYHDLTSLGKDEGNIRNLSVGSLDDGDRIVFTHAIETGPARRSYGLEVAKLSGLPSRVIKRADLLLREHHEDGVSDCAQQRSLFEYTSGVSIEKTVRDEVADAIKGVVLRLSPDEMTPKQALDVLFELQDLVESES